MPQRSLLRLHIFACLPQAGASLHNIEKIECSVDEVVFAADYFANRCVQIQVAACDAGLMPKTQQWAFAADDWSYEGSDPSLPWLWMEVPHRGDDQMYGFKPVLVEVLCEYHYGISPEDKQKPAYLVEDFMCEHAKPSDICQFANAKR